MASKAPDDPCNTEETDVETIALRRKRSRRVSFADREITSVHIFNRDDDDYETPPRTSEDQQKQPALFRDLVDSYDSTEDVLDGLLNGRESFLRPTESPSPGGSSTVGSATSNDEGNFFGPVSAEFITPGQLSDSAASDNNHDITMDSTAFSMHFRSLLRSESADLQTPTGVHLAFEEKTPSQVTSSSAPGSFVSLTKVKKLMPRLPVTVDKISSPIPVDKISGGRDSNDMSLVVGNLRKYDYDKLSPGLEALLTEGSKNLDAVHASDSDNKGSLKMSEVALSEDNCDGHMEPQDHGDSELCHVDNHDRSEGVSVTHVENAKLPVNGQVQTPNQHNHDLSEKASVKHAKLENTGSVLAPILSDQITHGFSAHAIGGPAAELPVSHWVLTPSHHNHVMSEEFSVTHVELENTGSVLVPTPSHQNTCAAEVSVSRQVQIPNQLNRENNKVSKVAVNIVTPPSKISGALQLDLSQQLESANQLSTKDGSKGFPFTGKRHSSDIDQISDHYSGSQISAEQRQMPSGTNKSARRALYVTPSPKQFSSFPDMDSIKLGSGPLLMKSNSKFKTLEPSPLSSTLRDKTEKLKTRLSELRSRVASPGSGIMEESSKGFGSHLGTPITNLEEQHKNMINMDIGSIGTQKDTSRLIQDGKMAGNGKGEEHKDKLTHRVAAMASPSKFTLSGKEVLLHPFLMSEDPVDRTPIASRFNSSPAGITLDHCKDEREINTSNEFVSSLIKRLDQKLSSATNNQGYLSANSNNEKQGNKLVPISSGQDNSSIEAVATDNHLTVMAEINSFNQVETMDERESYAPNLQSPPETLKHFLYILRDRDALRLVSGSQEKNMSGSLGKCPEIATEANLSSERFLNAVTKASFACASPDAHRRITNEQSPLKVLSENKKTQNATSEASRKDVQSSSSSLSRQSNDDCHQGSHILQNPNSVHDVQKSSKRAKTSKEIAFGDADLADKFSWSQQSPKVHKVGENNMESILEYSNGNKKGSRKMEGTALINWNDISFKLSADINQLLSPLVDKLNIRVMDMLEDVFVHWQKIHVFERMHSEIQFQKIYDHSSKFRHKRLAEVKLLLYKVVYEKVKSQLMHVKRTRFLEQVQKLRTGILESQMLKLNCVRHMSANGEKNAKVDDISCIVNHDGKNEVQSFVTHNQVTTMKHEVESLERKIKNLTKSFQVYCKMKGEPNSSDTIILVNDHLKKKTMCRFVRQDMQLWEAHDFQNRNGQLSFVFNYGGLICQRLSLNVGLISSIFVSNKLNDIDIMKSFPNMEACSAFAFVFNTESTKKLVGPKSLAQETQRTSLLLGNLLDVVEEVQQARIEIKYLTHTSFYSPSAEQLNLQLTFVDVNSGRKVMTTLDMTCLNRGVYPSEILPNKLQDVTTGTKKSLPQLLLSDIDAAVGSLRVGYRRILRLCHCASKVIQSQSKP